MDVTAQGPAGGGPEVWQVVLPQLGETVAEGTVVRWCVKEGDLVERDDALFEVSTDKVDTEVPAARAGWLREVLVPEGCSAPVGAPVATMSSTPDGPLGAAAAAPEPVQPVAARTSDAAASVAEGSGPVARQGVNGFLSPAVHRLLDAHGLDGGQVAGSGRDGRVTRADVLAAAAQGSAAVDLGPLHDGDEVVEYSRARVATARAMEAARRGPVCTHVAVQVRWAAVERARRAAGTTYLPFVGRAVCVALAAHPELNAHTDGRRLVLRRSVGLGVAVQSDGALVVPVVAGAERLRLAALAGEMSDVAAAVRERRWLPGAPATFTVTSVGRWGTVVALPELVPPQVGILSVDGVSPQPVAVRDGDGWAVGVEPVGNLTLGFDHRAVDGELAARFLDAVRRELEGRDWGSEL